MTRRVEIERRSVSAVFVPIGEPPVLKMELEDNERVIALDLHSSPFPDHERVTEDWYGTITIERTVS